VEERREGDLKSRRNFRNIFWIENQNFNEILRPGVVAIQRGLVDNLQLEETKTHKE
jgi:hypothetical protein